MKRKNFLKGLGLASFSLALPATTTTTNAKPQSQSCVLIPSETAGPFPLDLTENTFYFRQDVREDRTGKQLNLKLKIIGENNCEPMPNVRVNIWHCDKDGLYSGYQTEVGKTYLRGYQIADQNGEVNFTTIFPGWYTGRVCHIHFQVFVNSNYSAVSQLTFDQQTKNDLYANNTTEYTKGDDPQTPSTDGIFSDGYQYQLATLVANPLGSYDSYLEVTVKGTGVGIGYIEKQNNEQFTLHQNYPNPYNLQTTIPFTLHKPSQVTLTLWNIEGKKIATLLQQQNLPKGDHQIDFEPKKYNLLPQNLVYQIEIQNNEGTFKNFKLMTLKP